MKREFLKGLGIEDENMISQILDEAGKDLNAKKSEITNLRAEIANKDKEMESLKTKGKSADSLAEQVKELLPTFFRHNYKYNIILYLTET